MKADARLKAVFLEALEKPSLADRGAYLDAACEGDAGLRQRVEAMLRVHARPDRLLDRPAGIGLDERPTEAIPPADPLAHLARPTKPGSLGRLGKYELLEIAGRGGMGVVFRASDEKLGRLVAIKALASHLAGHEEARQRFAREARSAAAVEHENVVAIHAVEDDGPIPFLVMQFIDGPTLLKKLADSGRLPLGEILRLGLGIARGLAAAHAVGIVHRDLKPANILLSRGTPKITDFGLARAIDDTILTQPGSVAGTPAYMSPEQARGEKADHRADLFSLGSVLYEMATGLRPFQADSSLAIMKRVCDETLKPAHKVNPELPAWLGKLVARLHAKEPSGRFASADEVAQELERRLAEPENARPRRARLGWVAGGVLAVVAAVAVGWRLLPGPLAEEKAGVAEAAPVGKKEPPAPPEKKREPEAELPRPLLPQDEWGKKVGALPSAEEKANAVMTRLKELNKDWDGRQHRFEQAGNEVVGLFFPNETVTDLSPLRALPHLAHLECPGPTYKRRSKLADLSPLQGLPLKHLNLQHSDVADLRPLRRMPLETLLLGMTKVADLKPLEGMPLERLDVSLSKVGDPTPIKTLKNLAWLDLEMVPVRDLSFLEGLPLARLNLRRTGADPATIRGLPLKEITLTYKALQHEAILRSMKGLERINSWPATVFWEKWSKIDSAY
ncbi:MAG: protein kinase [Gemmataceae bacterium]|nr:protein kinase [Gemmataceae bacterium]